MGAGGEVVVHDWLKLAILLLFRVSEMNTMEVAGRVRHKAPVEEGRRRRGCPGRARRLGQVGADLEPGTVMMPS